MTFQRSLTCMIIITSLSGCYREMRSAESGTAAGTGSAGNAGARLSVYTTNALLSPYDNSVLADNPVAFWNDATLADVSGHAHTSVAMNAPVATALPNGDQSLLFNGTNQYVEVSSSPDLSVPATGILTLEAWVRPDVLTFPAMEGTGYVNWMGKGEPGQHEYVCRMYAQNPVNEDEGRTNRITGSVFTPAGASIAGSYYQPTSGQPVTAGEWLHYVLVINTKAISTAYPNGYTKLYVQRKNSNGDLVLYEDQDALNNISLAAGTAPFRIGTRNFGSYFKGVIGKIAVYNYEPETARIIEHGNKMFGYDYQVLSDNPVAYWNTAGKDITGHGHQATLFNSPGISTMPNGDLSWVFNGTTQYVQVASKPDLSVPTTGMLTLEAWIRPDVLDFEKMILSGYVHWAGKRENGQCEYVARMYGTNPTGYDTLRVNRISGYAYNLTGGEGAGSYYQAAPAWRVQAGEWIHCTIIINTVNTSVGYTTGYTKIYVRRKNSSGTIVTFTDKDALTGYSIIPEAGTAAFRIGTEDLSSFFHGSIGKVAIYNYELSAARSLQHAEMQFNQ